MINFNFGHLTIWVGISLICRPLPSTLIINWTHHNNFYGAILLTFPLNTKFNLYPHTYSCGTYSVKFFKPIILQSDCNCHVSEWMRNHLSSVGDIYDIWLEYQDYSVDELEDSLSDDND
jgi:hypothetical protein